jgi:uncharacterized RDD family membrane protein YckC
MSIIDVIFPFSFYFIEDLFTLAFLGACFLYLVLAEVRFGYTIGKKVFRLKTVRVDGRALEYREAMIRNVTKVFPPLLALDVLFYLLVFKADDQRASDRLAETIVIDTAKPVWSPPPAPAAPSSPVPPAPNQFIPVDSASPPIEPGPGR